MSDRDTSNQDSNPVGIRLPSDHPPAARTGRFGPAVRVPLDDTLTHQLSVFSRTERATLSMVLLAAYSTLLARYDGRPFVTLVYDAGDGTEPHAFRADLSSRPIFSELVRHVRDEVLDLASRQRTARPAESTQDVHDVTFQDNADPAGAAPGRQADLSLSVAGTVATLHYDTGCWASDTVTALAATLTELVVDALARPTRPVDSLRLLPVAERDRALVSGRSVAVDDIPATTVHRLFEAQSARTPDAPAIEDGERTLSYREIDTRANQIAHHLGSLGMGPESVIALAAPRSLETFVALLGILKAGAAYLPLDPGYPPERVSYILADAGAAALVTDSATERRLPPPRTPIVVLDDSDDRDAIDGAPDTPPDSPAGPDNLAYVIYTSGSTGRPKGVEISHRSAVGLAHTVRESFGVRPDDRVAQFASLSFDASVWELLMAIGAGACLTIVPTSGEGASEIEGRLRDLRITVGTFPPSFLATVDPAKLPALRLVVSAGEHCAASLARAWSAGRRFVNAYGPTEATVCATFADPDGDTTPTIGRPLPGVSAHALGIDLDPLPAGVPGELHLAGIGLARGYRGRPSTTAAVFVPDPYGPSGTRLYRTRDFGRRLATGEIQHIGRIDQQVKIRGYRIECGEIESTLAGHPAVGQAAVVVTDTPAAGPQLVAYVTPGVSKPDDADSVLDPAELHRFLASALPQYMIPSRFGVLADLPRTTSGKIDRAALPELTEIPAAAEVHGNAPETPTERRIAAIWARMLGLSWVSRADNFLEIGGHSLVAAQVIAAIREELGVRRIPVRLLFELPSLSDFSTAIDATVADAMAGSAT